MTRNYTCTPEMFEATLDSLLNGVVKSCDTRVRKAVEQSTRKGTKIVKEKAAGVGKHEWSERYISGFSSRIERGNMETTGEIGNKNKPGLVHLLEKGHATLTGRRTNAYPHMAPAFEEMEDDFIARVEKAIGEALAG